LLQRLRANESEAWHVMVELYTPLVCHWCARGGVRGADAEDVAQEVFHAAASHLEDFRRDRPGDSFRGWLRGITRNMVLQHFRRGARHPKAAGGSDALQRLQEVEGGSAGGGSEDMDPAVGGGSEDEGPAEELDGLRRRALELVRGEFEERTWQFFWQTVVEGRAPVDIAADAGVSSAAVRMAKSRVLHRLKEAFGDLIH
jgi:RNA polymerase sigma-70 factor (ECF subfamily)